MRLIIISLFTLLLTACNDPIVNWGSSSSVQVLEQVDESRCNHIAKVQGLGTKSTGGAFTLRPPTSAEDDAKRNLMDNAERAGGNALVLNQPPQSTDNGATATASATVYFCQ